jgi:hypothetical protein
VSYRHGIHDDGSGSNGCVDTSVAQQVEFFILGLSGEKLHLSSMTGLVPFTQAVKLPENSDWPEAAGSRGRLERAGRTATALPQNAMSLA